MRLVATVSGNFEPLLDNQADEISNALRAGIETASTSLLEELRGQTRAVGLGTGLEKAWRRELYPRSRKRTGDTLSSAEAAQIEQAALAVGSTGQVFAARLHTDPARTRCFGVFSRAPTLTRISNALYHEYLRPLVAPAPEATP